MRVETRPARRLKRGTAVLPGRRRGEMHDGDVVVRVPLGWRTYCYVCRENPQMGTLVEVVTPVSGATVVPVSGFGRDGYSGPLKRARIVR